MFYRKLSLGILLGTNILLVFLCYFLHGTTAEKEKIESELNVLMRFERITKYRQLENVDHFLNMYKADTFIIQNKEISIAECESIQSWLAFYKKLRSTENGNLIPELKSFPKIEDTVLNKLTPELAAKYVIFQLKHDLFKFQQRQKNYNIKAIIHGVEQNDSMASIYMRPFITSNHDELEYFIGDSAITEMPVVWTGPLRKLKAIYTSSRDGVKQIFHGSDQQTEVEWLSKTY